MAKGNCKLCKTIFIGRTGKTFCSIKCKSEYNYKLRLATSIATARIDKILHRNRSILLEILGKTQSHLKVDRAILDKKKFHFNYITHHHINKQGKMVNYVYDFSWMIFSDQEVLITRVK